MDKSLDVVIMAAGKGTRMRSKLPKVLHQLAGRALIQHVMTTVQGLSSRKLVIVTGHGAEQVEQALSHERPAPSFVRQQPQLGTGHAVMQALPLLDDDGVTLVLSGDVPLTETATLAPLVQAARSGQLALLTVDTGDASGYGRVIRAGGQIQAIVEHKDASDQQRSLSEWYSGVLALPTVMLRRWLGRLGNHNAQSEYYLTDIVRMAVADGVPVAAHCISDIAQVQGVNDPAQLASLERVAQLRQAHRLMAQGVRLKDPARLDVRGQLACGEDVEIDVNCVFEGSVQLGDRVHIGAHCVIANVVVEADAVIHPFTHVDGGLAGATVGEGALVGPFARLRPGARLGPSVHVGNFVEVKNATLGRGAKANHLAYLGDATLGERVNYGAGSITANYDGVHKHQTVIGDDAHVGSNCVLVAPVTVGAGGTIGAGSTITRDTAAGALSISRARQATVPGWRRPGTGQTGDRAKTPEAPDQGST